MVAAVYRLPPESIEHDNSASFRQLGSNKSTHESDMQWFCPTCHDSCVMLTGLKGTLALPCFHLNSSILSLLQGEGGEVLEDDKRGGGRKCNNAESPYEYW